MSATNPRRYASSHAFSRRALVGSSLAAAAMWRLGAAPALGAQQEASSDPTTWRTWLLASADELRPATAPEPTAAERNELLDYQAKRTAEALAVVDHWDDQTVILPWTNLALDLIRLHQPSPVRAGRALALLHVALCDTLVATLDAQAAYPRPAPAMMDKTIMPMGRNPGGLSSFPSEHAAAAAAAATVLAFLFPKEPADGLAALAEEAAISRLLAGRAYREDIEAGQTIGRAVGARAVAWGKADGSAAMWDGAGRLSDPGAWQPTPPGYVQQPLDPLAGTWRTWVLASGDQYRPAPPPSYRSPAWQAELAALQEAVARRTPEQEDAIRFWAGGPGTVTPAGLWIEIARDLIVRDGLDGPHAARVLALTSVAMADAFICCWDAKYTYWTARPISADPALAVLIPTPPFPSFTSGHSTISAAAATVLGHLFPEDEATLRDRTEEAKNSRLWAGIHFPIDTEMGALGGGMIGRLVVARARTDGAE